MKRAITYTFIGIFLLVVGVLYLLLPSKLEKIPAFSFKKTADNKEFTDKDIKNKNIIFYYFDPSCGDCESEFDSLVKYKLKFEKYQKIIVSKSKIEDLDKHPIAVQSSKLSNSHLVVDTYGTFPQSFGLGSLIFYPTIFVFKDDKLIYKGTNIIETSVINI